MRRLLIVWSFWINPARRAKPHRKLASCPGTGKSLSVYWRPQKCPWSPSPTRRMMLYAGLKAFCSSGRIDRFFTVLVILERSSPLAWLGHQEVRRSGRSYGGFFSGFKAHNNNIIFPSGGKMPLAICFSCFVVRTRCCYATGVKLIMHDIL